MTRDKRGVTASGDVGNAVQDRLRVVIADDAPSIRTILRTLLLEDSVDIVGEAEDGAEAIEQAERLEPDVIVMDYQMPVIDGIEATRVIKERRPGIEVLGYTSIPYGQAVTEMHDAGASGTYDKLDVDRLVEALRQRIPRKVTSRTRLLIVDDDPYVRGILQERLEMTNVDIVGEATTGPDAIEKVESLDPHVVVMDLRMPEVDGIEATAQIKSRWPHIKVIGYSSFDDDAVAPSGADATFEKKDPERLVQAILEFA